ncbi:MAG: hypothetical protein L0215_22040, partial [Gemmataceae bacterium]|nr:hypothetical protein [Gemmataceae bacterium]
GHCFAARRVNGEASEIVLWPLGGLANVDLPHSPKAHFVTAVGGPLVNLLICFVTGATLLFAFDTVLRPTWNPFWIPYRNDRGLVELVSWDGSVFGTDNLAMIVLARLFWVSWITFLLNVLLIGFPLDGGRMFQAILWPYVGYRQATLYAVFAGFGCMLLVLLSSLVLKDVLPFFLGLYIYTACKQEYIVLETGSEESMFGYDFSQGYTSLERDEPPTEKPPRKRQNFIQRWLQRRAARKMQKEQEREQEEARRVDELLDKIQRFGKESLTDEEQRFLKRYADRMKNK